MLGKNRLALTLADIITLSRIPMSLLIIPAVLLNRWLESLVLIGLMALSDVIDGPIARYIAKKRGGETEHGGLLDTGSDKLTVLFWIFLITSQPLAPYTIILIAIYLGVQLILIIMGLKGLALRRRSVKVTIGGNSWGKAKTVLEVAAAVLFIIGAWSQNQALWWNLGSLLILGSVLAGTISIKKHLLALQKALSTSTSQD